MSLGLPGGQSEPRPRKKGRAFQASELLVPGRGGRQGPSEGPATSLCACSAFGASCQGGRG